MDQNQNDLARFRRQLSERQDLEYLRLGGSKPYFGGLRISRPHASIIVVDFGLSRQDPAVLILMNGFLQDFTPNKEMAVSVRDLEIDERAHARFIRWVGGLVGKDSWADFGVSEVIRREPVRWDFKNCNVLKNLEYLAELAGRLGIKRVGVVPEPGLSYSLPTVVGDGVRVKVLHGYKNEHDRLTAFRTLKKLLLDNIIRIPDGTQLLRRLLAVGVVDGDMPDEAHPMVGAAAALVMALKLDDLDQPYFAEDWT